MVASDSWAKKKAAKSHTRENSAIELLESIFTGEDSPSLTDSGIRYRGNDYNWGFSDLNYSEIDVWYGPLTKERVGIPLKIGKEAVLGKFYEFAKEMEEKYDDLKPRSKPRARLEWERGR